MTNLFSIKAKFDQVKFDIKAVQFHAIRWDNGSRDALAKTCYQYLQQLEAKHGSIPLA